MLFRCTKLLSNQRKSQILVYKGRKRSKRWQDARRFEKIEKNYKNLKLLSFFIILRKVPIKITENLDPLTLLTDNATVATWQNENLPSDRMSTENATILTNCERWPLMIDPQLQGIKWIKTREGEELRVVRLGQKGYWNIEKCFCLLWERDSVSGHATKISVLNIERA